MTSTVETLQSMGDQPDQYQARCKTCTPNWAGDVFDSRIDAMRDGLTHDADAHPAPEGADAAGLPVIDLDELLEQLETNAPRLAPVYAAHFDACTAHGFTREEALLLTSDWARATLWGAAL